MRGPHSGGQDVARRPVCTLLESQLAYRTTEDTSLSRHPGVHSATDQSRSSLALPLLKKTTCKDLFS